MGVRLENVSWTDFGTKKILQLMDVEMGKLWVSATYS